MTPNTVTFCKVSSFPFKWNHVYQENADQVYFVHPSTDISVDMSIDSRPMYRPIYRPTLDRYVGRHINRHSADIPTEICRSTYRPIHRPRYRLRVGRHIVRLSADIAAETRPIRWPLTVGGISVDCRWYIGRFSYNVSQNLRLPVMSISCFFVQP